MGKCIDKRINFLRRNSPVYPSVAFSGCCINQVCAQNDFESAGTTHFQVEILGSTPTRHNAHQPFTLGQCAVTNGGKTHVSRCNEFRAPSPGNSSQFDDCYLWLIPQHFIKSLKRVKTCRCALCQFFHCLTIQGHVYVGNKEIGVSTVEYNYLHRFISCCINQEFFKLRYQLNT